MHLMIKNNKYSLVNIIIILVFKQSINSNSFYWLKPKIWGELFTISNQTIIYMFSNLYKNTSFPAFSVCSLLRNLEWTRPKVLNILSIPAVLALAVNSCSTRDNMCSSSIEAWDCHQARGSVTLTTSGSNM